jgi:hypothetical protein
MYHISFFVIIKVPHVIQNETEQTKNKVIHHMDKKYLTLKLFTSVEVNRNGNFKVKIVFKNLDVRYN